MFLLTVTLNLHKSFYLVSIFLLILWLHWVLVAACGIFLAVHRLLSSCGMQAAGHVGFVAAAHGLSGCDTPASLPCSMWDFSSLIRDQIKQMFPVLEGGFLTIGTPGKSLPSI